MAAQKRKHPWDSRLLLPIAVYGFLVSFLLFLCASLILRTYNNNLCAQQQSVKEEVLSLTQQNEETQREINDLSSAERVAAISESTLSYQSQNIISVPSGQ